jgi:hypothetical protein
MVVEVEPCGSSAALSVATTSPDLKELACRKAPQSNSLCRQVQAATEKANLSVTASFFT